MIPAVTCIGGFGDGCKTFAAYVLIFWLRVHAKEIGHPLLGDDTYGGGAAAAADRLSRGSAVIKERVMGIVEEFGRPALHAATLGFTHPASGEFVKFSAPVPMDMTTVVEALRGDIHGGEPTPP
jgi:tRNA pseudouridine synthase 2